MDTEMNRFQLIELTVQSSGSFVGDTVGLSKFKLK